MLLRVGMEDWDRELVRGWGVKETWVWLFMLAAVIVGACCVVVAPALATVVRIAGC